MMPIASSAIRLQQKAPLVRGFLIWMAVEEGLTRDIPVARALPSFAVQKRYPAFLSNPLVGFLSKQPKAKSPACARLFVLDGG